MKRFIVFLFFIVFLKAHSLHYILKAPLFGKEGDLYINYNINSNHYNVSMRLTTIGLAKKLSKNRIESYNANGFIVRNIYKAKHFVQDYSFSNKKGHTEYLFDYNNKRVYKIKKAWKNNKLQKSYKHPLKFFTYNDFVSIYHNIVATLSKKRAGTYKVLVAGMENFGGTLLIEVLPKSQAQKVAKELGANKNDFIFYLYTHKKILGSKSGKVIFAVNRDGIADVVRVVDIPFVSHIDAILER